MPRGARPPVTAVVGATVGLLAGAAVDGARRRGRLHAVQHITRVIIHGPDHIGAIVAGRLTLNLLTLIRLAQAEGAETEAGIAAKAGHILREWSRRLPD
jgi:hypothetical protein